MDTLINNVLLAFYILIGLFFLAAAIESWRDQLIQLAGVLDYFGSYLQYFSALDNGCQMQLTVALSSLLLCYHYLNRFVSAILRNWMKK